jgi:NRPS condensation-like uncharacterized protein
VRLDHIHTLTAMLGGLRGCSFGARRTIAPVDGSVMEAAGYFEVGTTDRTFALLAKRTDYTPTLEIDFDGCLDAGRLRTALALLAERHAILTATFDPDSWRARWQPGTTHPQFVSVDEPGRAGHAVLARALDATVPFDTAVGPTCRLLHSRAARGSRMILSISHAVCDARGLVVLLDDLRRIYARLEHDEGLVPDRDWFPRTPAGLLELRGVTRAERLRMARAAWDRWAQVRPSTDARGGAGAPSSPSEPDGRVTRLDAELCPRVRVAASRLGVSVNHLLLGALARAWIDAVGPGAEEPGVSGWLVAVDGRRAFGATRGVGNISANEPVALVGVERETLRATAEVALREFRTLRARGAGMTPDLAAMWSGSLAGPVANLGIESTFAGRSMTRLDRVFSHLDRFPDSFEDWGDATAEGVRWSAAPGPPAPLVLMLLTTFADVCELTQIATPEALAPAQMVAISRSLLDQLEQLVDDDRVTGGARAF